MVQLPRSHAPAAASGLRQALQPASLAACVRPRSRPRAVAAAAAAAPDESAAVVGRRAALVGAALAVGLRGAAPACAVQGLTAGRLPGLTPEPDADGFYLYTRPEGKSGGHGVGWSEMPRYSFKVPEGWEETPVSIADLGGTEIDLRFARPDQGNLQVVVAPVLRFADVGFNADVRIDQLNQPDAIISGFAPELFGRPLNEGDVLEQRETVKGGVKYYEWEVKPHNLVSATAVGNRVFIISIAAKSSRVWARAADTLRAMQASFFVPAPGAAA
ncbi:PPD4 [Scenedesmus sp. PABB004]|nr:PPD4 [Scenedesmus sp. PABB004]